MFKSKIFRYSAIAAAVVVVTSGAIWASNANLQSQSQAPELNSEILAQNPNRPDRSENADMPSGRMLKQLNLSTEQLQKLKAIRDLDITRIRDLSQQLSQANKELRDLLASTDGSDVIRAKHTQVMRLQQELQNQHFERMLAMREILTPQQRSQFNESMQKNRPNRMKEGMRDRMENRMKNFRDRSTL
jgi:protein CpxP